MAAAAAGEPETKGEEEENIWQSLLGKAAHTALTESTVVILGTCDPVAASLRPFEKRRRV